MKILFHLPEIVAIHTLSICVSAILADSSHIDLLAFILSLGRTKSTSSPSSSDRPRPCIPALPFPSSSTGIVRSNRVLTVWGSRPAAIAEITEPRATVPKGVSTTPDSLGHLSTFGVNDLPGLRGS